MPKNDKKPQSQAKDEPKAASKAKAPEDEAQYIGAPVANDEDAESVSKRSGPPPDSDLADDMGSDDPVMNITPRGDAVPITDPHLSPEAQQPGESPEDFARRTGKPY